MKSYREEKGLIIVNTGNGKGKTTAAFGAALRAAGHGMKIKIVQFLKKDGDYGEAKAIAILPNVQVETRGAGFINSESIEESIKKTREAWQDCKKYLASGEYDMLILDEVLYAIKYGFLSADEVVKELTEKPEAVHIILTGRHAPPKILELADLVTEMREIKHPYRKGQRARKGIEF